jgi:hypothetical protein
MMKGDQLATEKEIYDQFSNWNGTGPCCPAVCRGADPEDLEQHGLANILTSDSLVTHPCCAYAIWYKAFKSEKEQPKQKGKWQNLWLKHCLSDETAYLFATLSRIRGADGEISIRREESVKLIIKEGILRDNGPLRALLHLNSQMD